jgi:Magnesium chelatase, subunit ChlI
VVFLDELTEFRRDAIESFRQPLEDGRIVATRMAGQVEFRRASRWAPRPPVERWRAHPADAVRG